MEERDIRKAYLKGHGCINSIIKSVPFIQVEDEPRLIELVKGMYKLDLGALCMSSVFFLLLSVLQ